MLELVNYWTEGLLCDTEYPRFAHFHVQFQATRLKLLKREQDERWKRSPISVSQQERVVCQNKVMLTLLMVAFSWPCGGLRGLVMAAQNKH